jgi:nicotinamide mononucleotide transporter
MDTHHHWLELLSLAFVQVGGATVSEWCGALLGVINVIGVVRERPWCWWAALSSTLAYFLVFVHSQLWGQATLQVFYVGTSVYGYLAWRGSATRAAVVIHRMTRRASLALLIATLAVSLTVWWLLQAQSIAFGMLDSITTIASLVATALATQKLLESWLWWIVIDTLIALLCWSQGLLLSSGLYGLFVGLAVIGYWRWRTTMQVEASGHG